MSEKTSPHRRFVVDSMLGKVAKWLRVLGFDARYERFRRREQLEEYFRENRIPITRNHRWRGQPGVVRVTVDDPMEQLREVVSALEINPREVRLLHRCILCNEPLRSMAREDAFASVPEYVYETNARFFDCPRCRRIYWRGSHPGRMTGRLHDVLGWSL